MLSKMMLKMKLWLKDLGCGVFLGLVIYLITMFGLGVFKI